MWALVVTYDIVARAVPDITLRDLAGTAAVGLARDASAVASRQDLSAVHTSLEGVGLGVGGHGESASGGEGEERDDGELHFDGVVFEDCVKCGEFVEVVSLFIVNLFMVCISDGGHQGVALGIYILFFCLALLCLPSPSCYLFHEGVQTLMIS